MTYYSIILIRIHPPRVIPLGGAAPQRCFILFQYQDSRTHTAVQVALKGSLTDGREVLGQIILCLGLQIEQHSHARVHPSLIELGCAKPGWPSARGFPIPAVLYHPHLPPAYGGFSMYSGSTYIPRWVRITTHTHLQRMHLPWWFHGLPQIVSGVSLIVSKVDRIHLPTYRIGK
jgi:hypothetical protein